MNSQEQEIQVNVKPQEDLENRRRFIKGAGIATPVVLTLSSRSVFGAMCGSEIASGNQSHAVQGSCELGSSSATWLGMSVSNNPVNVAQPNTQTRDGTSCVKKSNTTPALPATQSIKTVAASWEEVTKINNKTTTKTKNGSCTITFNITPTLVGSYLWAGSSYSYGEQYKYVATVKNIQNSSSNNFAGKIKLAPAITITTTPDENFKVSATELQKGSTVISTLYGFTGGATYNSIFTSDVYGDLGSKTLREILSKNPNSDETYLITALLNAKYYGTKYPFSESDIRKLAAKDPTFPVPNYTPALLQKTW